MSKALKLYCKSSTFVDKLNSLKNYSKSSSMYCGSKTDSTIKNYFSSVINFSKININPSLIKSAFLFIYISGVNTHKEFPTNLYLAGSIENMNISQINYQNYEDNIITKPLPINFNSILINSYVKINITQVVKEIIQSNSNFNLIINTVNDYPTYFIKINSVNSKYAPYIELVLKNDILESSIEPKEKTNNLFIYENIIKKLDEQNKVITNIVDKVNDIHELINKFTNDFSSFTEKANIREVKKTSSPTLVKTSNKNINIDDIKSAIKIVNKDNSSRLTINSPDKHN